ncbi:MAG: aldose 1-epimerase [Bryobacteraceae bacterium]
MMLQAANYTAERTTVEGVDVIHLADAGAQTEVWIAPGFGNNAYSMKVKGQEIFWRPAAGLRDWMAKPAQGGNPLLHPWCNRIDQDAYFANGKKYLLNAGLNNYRRDGNGKPIHGLVVFANGWEVTDLSGGGDEAVTTSRLEFSRHPDWLAQFPWAHNVVMTHRLRGGVLEVEMCSKTCLLSQCRFRVIHSLSTLHRRSARRMEGPHRKGGDRVAFERADSDRRDKAGRADPTPLAGGQLDDVFTNLKRDADGRSRFSVQGKSQRITVEFGPAYPVGVIYAPPGRGFICFEPMAGVTNVFNLSHEGKFPLQSVPAGGEWRESFWIRPGGF